METQPVQWPIDGVLDLHSFRPQDVAEVLRDYLAECRARGILEVRVIHGKGQGVICRTVHALLARMPEVARFNLATPTYGGHGATLVHLKPPDSP